MEEFELMAVLPVAHSSRRKTKRWYLAQEKSLLRKFKEAVTRQPASAPQRPLGELQPAVEESQHKSVREHVSKRSLLEEPY